MKFDRHIGSTAAEVPVKFRSDRTILDTNLAASRLDEILRKDVFSDIETGSWTLDIYALFNVELRSGVCIVIKDASNESTNINGTSTSNAQGRYLSYGCFVYS